MSRIHDALVRAEQERSSNGANSTATPPIAVAEPESLSNDLATTPAPVAISAEHDEREPHAEPRAAVAAGQLSYEVLQARCAQRPWEFAAGRNLAALQGNGLGLEELRTLRTRLYQLRGTGDPLKIVLIASSLPGEGKTFLSCAFSQMIARQKGRRVLVIDGDLRLPRLHQEFGAPGAPGVTEYLKGEADEFAIVQRGPVEGLMLIPGGKPAANPAELLAGNGMRRLLDRVAPCFDWVLIDSPAAVPIADASMLAAVCHGVLMVVRAGSTPYDLAQRTRQEFSQARMLGVVLNGVSAKSSYTNYYYRSYAGANG